MLDVAKQTSVSNASALSSFAGIAGVLETRLLPWIEGVIGAGTLNGKCRLLRFGVMGPDVMISLGLRLL